MNTGTLGVSAEEGLDISGVLYNYTAVKNVVNDFTVTIENDKVGGGYVFKDTEDWSGKHGGKVQNVIPLPYTPIEQFGDGRIRGTGTGSIEDVTILYMYRWDLCRNAQNDESCPNYIPPLPVIPKIEIYDALDDEFVNKYLNILKHERGGGYWLWKINIINKTLKEMKDNDILLYMDAGSSLNYFAKKFRYRK